MGRVVCEAIHRRLMIDRCKALLRGGVFVLDLINHFTDEEWKHLAGSIGPAGITPDSRGEICEVTADDPKCHVYLIRRPRLNCDVQIYDSHPAIRCKACGYISHNGNDVLYLYCGKCHKFHYDGGIGVGGSSKIKAMVSDAIEKQCRGEQGEQAGRLLEAGLRRMAEAVQTGDKELKGGDWQYRPEDPKKFRQRVEQAAAKDDLERQANIEPSVFEKHTIEALLERHPQTCFPSPLALAVQRFGSTQEPIR